jgi:uncharacterized membrane protein
MKDLKGLRITYIGDWVFYTGPNFIESPFEMVAKDCHLSFIGKPVTEALEKAGATVDAYSNWQLYHFGPDEFESIVRRSDLVVLSDVEARCFYLHPDFFDRTKYGHEIISFPDRLKFLARWVESGKALLFMGGWLSFSGHMEKGGWRRSPIADWLPFECLTGDDLVETSEGFQVDAVEPGHATVCDLRLKSLPPLLGYNEIKARPSMKTVLRIAGTNHPLLGVSEHGKGRMVTYASDPVPHWGMNILLWEDYAAFWQNLAAWACKR